VVGTFFFFSHLSAVFSYLQKKLLQIKYNI